MRILTTIVIAQLLVLALAIAAPAAEAAPVTTTLAQRVAAASAAESKVGAPYARGAVGPRSFDCSGLVDFAYRVAGRPLGVRTSYQMWNIGARISRTDLRRGDMVFTWDRAKGHVGIYVGRGHYVHVPAPGRRVEIDPLPKSGAGYYGAVRP